MDTSKLGGGVVLLLAGAWGCVVLASLVLDNELFRSSELGTAAAVTLGFVVLVLAGYAALGGVWNRRTHTPYW